MSTGSATITQAPASMTCPFAGRVNFDWMREELNKQRDTQNKPPISEETWQNCTSICRNIVTKHEGGALFGNDLTSGIPSILYALFSAIQNLLGMGSSSTSGNFLANISSAFDHSGETLKAFNVDQAMFEIHEKLTDLKGDYAEIADFITSKAVGHNVPVPDMPGSLYNQLVATLDQTKLPADLNTSLDANIARSKAKAAAAATQLASTDTSSNDGHGLPASVTKPLTDTRTPA